MAYIGTLTVPQLHLLCVLRESTGQSQAKLRIINFKTTRINKVPVEVKLSYIHMVSQLG